MTRGLLKQLAGETRKLERAGLYKQEVLLSPDDESRGQPDSGGRIHFMAQDYLALSRRSEVREAAVKAMEIHGNGLFSSRAFGGTRSAHKELENALSDFLEVPEAILFGTGYLANIGFFDTLFDSRDCVLCDAWIHPSLAEGVRLSGARAFPYRNSDIGDLEDKLKRSRAARYRAIVTDGVFPLDGNIAPLQEICQLADKYDALVVIDDSLGVGVMGARGKGTREYRQVMERVDVVTGSFSDVLGGAAGGYVAGREEIVTWLRQKSTPYLFSSALPPAAVGAAATSLQLLAQGRLSVQALHQQVATLKRGLVEKQFRVLGGEHPILTVVVGDAITLQKMVNALSELGIDVQGLCYPVVPEQEARIQLQVSVLHTDDQIDRAINGFDKARRHLDRP